MRSPVPAFVILSLVLVLVFLFSTTPRAVPAHELLSDIEEGRTPPQPALKASAGASYLQSKSSETTGRQVLAAGGAHMMGGGSAGSGVTAAIIWLHGLGDSPSGMFTETVRSHISKTPGLQHIEWIVPAAPVQRVTCNGRMRMPSWFDMPELPLTSTSKLSDPQDVNVAARTVHDLIQKCIQRGIAASRIVVGGFSQGGASTIVSVLTYPQTLAGAAVLWGWIPIPTQVLEGQVTALGKKTPFLWSHGDQDHVVEYENAELGCMALEKMGVTCTLERQHDVGHHVSKGENELLSRWLKERLPSQD